LCVITYYLVPEHYGTFRDFRTFLHFNNGNFPATDSNKIAAYSKSMEIESNETERSISSSSVIAAVTHRTQDAALYTDCKTSLKPKRAMRFPFLVANALLTSFTITPMRLWIFWWWEKTCLTKFVISPTHSGKKKGFTVKN